MTSAESEELELVELKAQLVALICNHVELRQRISVNDDAPIPDPDTIPQVGDVILMSAKPSVIAYQTLVRGKRAHFSHAAISLGGGLYVDSLPMKRIGVRKIRDLKAGVKLKAFRYSEQNIDTKIISEIISYIGNNYSLKGMTKIPKKYHESYGEMLFCSEFIQRVYGDNLIQSNNKDNIVLPCDLENLDEQSGWSQVTRYYDTEFSNPDYIISAVEEAVISAVAIIGPIKGFNYARIDFDQYMARFK